MKKLLSIAAVLVLLLTLAAPALAAEINYPSVINGEIEATSDDGTKVEIDPANPANVDENSLKQAIGNSGKVTGDDYGVDVFEAFALDEDGNKTERTTPIAITFYYENAERVIAAFIQNSDKSWTEIEFSVSGKYVTVYAPHLTPIALVLRPESAPVTPGSGDAGTHTSPFTGDYTVIWAAVAVAMVLCAGACFVSARKKSAE